jgi:hypothetical protein
MSLAYVIVDVLTDMPLRGPMTAAQALARLDWVHLQTFSAALALGPPPERAEHGRVAPG